MALTGTLSGVAPGQEGETIRLVPSDAKLDNVRIDKAGFAHLAPDADRGSCTWALAFDHPVALAAVSIDAASSPTDSLTTDADVLVQLRWRMNDGDWSPWWPENILPGGEFRDRDGSGLADLADILEFDGAAILRSDLPDARMPDWVTTHVMTASSPLVHSTAGGPELIVPKPRAAGQVIVQMRSDRIPPAPFVTVSGWNGWDLGDIHTMGLMSRFHEIDRHGDRLDKIMFIGDDDWHQPGGTAPLRWRAVTFQPHDATRRLNLYAARLISSPGTLRAARYQVRCDSLADPRVATPFDARFHAPSLQDPDAWMFEDSGLAALDDGILTLRPLPHTNTWALSRPFDLPEVPRIGFAVEMDVQVPERYNDFDPSHKAWASTYLELLSEYEDTVLDVIKISVCRPRFGSLLASAGERPAAARKVRLRLVASHQSYLSEDQKANMTGEMIVRWRHLQLFKCTYPTVWRGRLDRDPIQPNEIPPSTVYEFRAQLLADPSIPPPVLHRLTVNARE